MLSPIMISVRAASAVLHKGRILSSLKSIFLIANLVMPLLIASASADNASQLTAGQDGAGFAQEMLRQQSSLSHPSNADSAASKATQQEHASTIAEYTGAIADHLSKHEKYAKGVQSEYSQQADIRNISKELEFVTGKLPAIEEGCKDCNGFIAQNDPRQSDQTSRLAIEDGVSESGIIVFVSFSMPEASLVELSIESQKYNALLVLRGLFQDSFLKNNEKFLSLSSTGLSLSIHPELFKQYGIKRVPTFVLVKNGKEVSRLSGNVTLAYASSKLREGR